MSRLPLTCRKDRVSTKPRDRLLNHDFSQLRLPRLNQTEEDHRLMQWLNGEPIQNLIEAKL
jgi:hypothetical protein